MYIVKLFQEGFPVTFAIIPDDDFRRARSQSAAEGAYAENSQAKGLEPDGPPESPPCGHRRSNPAVRHPEAAGRENLSGNETECAAGRIPSFYTPCGTVHITVIRRK